MATGDAPTDDPGGRLRLTMLQEIYDLGLDAAGDIWPTPGMALGRLFERGVTFLDAGGDLAQITGDASADVLDAFNVCREDLFPIEALYLQTRSVAFALTQQSTVLEQTWLGLADRHLAIRAEIVERRREEEALKRQLKALGGAVIQLPEHDELLMPDSDRPRKSRGMFQQLFEGAALGEAELDVAGPAREVAERVIVTRGWDAEWGDDALLLVLTYGISLALREREADVVDANADESVKAAHGEARRRMMGLDGRYATLRRRLFELRHNNRIVGWRITALEVEAVGMRRRLDQFLVDRDRLEEEIAARIAAGAVPPAPAVQPSDPGRQPWRQRLGRLFGRDG